MMVRYLIERLLWTTATLVGMSVVAFSLVALAPGDPISAELRFLGVPAKPETLEALRREYDLDAPLPERYVRWATRVVRLDLGRSIASGRPVAGELARALPSTLALAFVTLVLIIVISVLAASLVIIPAPPWVDRLLQGATVAALSVPVYWVALAALTVGLLWLRVPGLLDSDSWANLGVASILLACAPGLSIGRIIRERVAAERSEDYVRFGTALSLSGRQILFTDIGRVVAPAFVTLLANSFGFLLGGSIVMERVFNRPGLGSLALQAIAARDYPVLQSYLLLSGTLFVFVNAVADLLSVWADPRLRRVGDHA